VYLTLPTDIAHTEISSARLGIPLERHISSNDADVERFVLDEIVKLIEAAGRDIVILVDACAIRHDVRAELGELLVKTGYPVYSAPMGKTAVSEKYARYGGVSFLTSEVDVAHLSPKDLRRVD
jgi:pyruvate decarboxylase